MEDILGMQNTILGTGFQVIIALLTLFIGYGTLCLVGVIVGSVACDAVRTFRVFLKKQGLIPLR